MLARGVDKVAVQAKGGWATEESFIHNYARLHNRIDFDELFVRAAREWLPGEPQPDPGAIGLLPDGNLCVVDAGRRSMVSEGKSPSVEAPAADAEVIRAPPDGGQQQHQAETEEIAQTSRAPHCCGCGRRIAWEPSTECAHGERHLRCLCDPTLARE
eukprot:TRINITY_DN22981_c0_g2_i4.p1 TRINITY_DN22981_c0_g2~~TRINITY_DN22981_c0_g2_i4.p1  ORF type:complete len:157 (-),score=9.72 TRINITY_DN22981_c0_g2_i4:115-585(-)